MFKYISIMLLLIFLSSTVYAEVYRLKDDALERAFPDAASIEKLNLFLGEGDVKAIQEKAKARIESRLYTCYTALGKDGKVAGYAFFGSQTVRTKAAAYMVALGPDGSIRQVEILAFYEPEEYLPRSRWFERFKGMVLSEELSVKRGILPITGATLSVNCITAEVRKVLAVFEVMVRERGRR